MSKLRDYVLETSAINRNVVDSIDEQGGSGGGDIETITAHIRGIIIDPQTGTYTGRVGATVLTVYAVSLETLAPFSEWNINNDVVDIELPAADGIATIAKTLEGAIFVDDQTVAHINDLPEDCVVSGITFKYDYGISYMEVADEANILIIFPQDEN